jgi:hypothetical protein
MSLAGIVSGFGRRPLKLPVAEAAGDVQAMSVKRMNCMRACGHAGLGGFVVMAVYRRAAQNAQRQLPGRLARRCG